MFQDCLRLWVCSTSKDHRNSGAWDRGTQKGVINRAAGSSWSIIAASALSKRGNQFVPFSCTMQHVVSLHPLPFKSHYYAVFLHEEISEKTVTDKSIWKQLQGRQASKKKKKEGVAVNMKVHSGLLIFQQLLAGLLTLLCNSVDILSFLALTHLAFVSACISLPPNWGWREKRGFLETMARILLCIRTALCKAALKLP